MFMIGINKKMKKKMKSKFNEYLEMGKGERYKEEEERYIREYLNNYSLSNLHDWGRDIDGYHQDMDKTKLVNLLLKKMPNSEKREILHKD